MDIQHVFLKRKQKISRLFLSIVAILLIVCMLPTQVFAGEGVEIVIKGNGGGNTSVTYGKPDELSGKAHQITVNNRKLICVGYRVYAVSKVDGTLNTSLGVIDILDSSVKTSIDEFKALNIKKTDYGIMIGTNKVESTEKYASFTTDSKKDAVLSSENITNIYKAVHGRSVTDSHGDLFHDWMVRNDGKNMVALSRFAFGLSSEEQFTENLKGYKVVVEPLILTSIFTDLTYVPVEKKYNNYMKHLLETNVTVVDGTIHFNIIDLCCRESSDTKLTMEQYAELEPGNYDNYSDSIKLYYYEQYNEVLNEKLVQAVVDTADGTAEVMRDLNFSGRYFNSLNKEEQLKVYNELTKRINEGRKTANGNDYEYQYGLNYTAEIYYDYTINQEILNKYEAENIFYADSTYAYSYRDNGYPCPEIKENGVLKHKISIDTGVQILSTYNNIKEYLKTVPKLNGGVGSDNGPLRGYLTTTGSGYYLSTTEFGIAGGTQGIHIYDPSLASGKPIHTKDPETPDPSIPHKPEEPKPEKQNNGECTIIKVYGNVYKDGSNYYHIEDVTTEVRTGTTNSIVIEQESPYNLVEWRVAKQSFTSLTATQWKSISSTNTIKQKTLPFTTYELKQSGDSGFTTTANNPYKMEDGTVLYLLYLKQMPYIETSDKPTPFTQDPTVPNPTKPENPSSDKNNQNNPDKKGSYNIIKVYTILDEYNGTPLSSETYTQSSTTPFIKIEQESNWTLAHWKVTNTYNPSITAGDWCGTASTEDQLNQFYLNHFYDISSTSKFGTTYTGLTGNTPSTYYFNTSGTKDTLYILFVRTKGQAEYDAATQHITESYITKRFSTAGYWDYTNTFIPGDMEITVTTSSGEVTEIFREHLIPLVFNKNLSGTKWEKDNATISIQPSISIDGLLLNKAGNFQVYKYVKSAGHTYRTTYDYNKVYRNQFNAETIYFKDLEARFVAARIGDSVNLAKFKVCTTDVKNRYNTITSLTNAISNFVAESNAKSNRATTNILTGDSRMLFEISGTDNALTTKTNTDSEKGSLEDIREIELNLTVEAEVFTGEGYRGTADTDDKPINNMSSSNTATSGIRTSKLFSGSSSVNFTPYIRMQFDEINSANNIVYVMGKQDSTLKVNEYAGIYFKVPSNKTAIFKPNTTNKEDGKIQLSSNQWSTHASATAKVGENCVLPGGATLNIAVPEDARNTLHVETYYPILAGTGLIHVNATGSSNLPDHVTEDMKAEHAKFVTSTINGLETLNVQQWVSEELSANNISDDILTDRKTNKPVWSMSEATAPSYEGKDDKYYFRDDNDNDSDIGDVKSGDSNTGDLDVKQGKTVITYYTFYANTKGEIYCKNHSDLGVASNITSETDGTKIISSGNGIAELTGVYKNINDKTAIVTNLLAAIERNTGNDKNAFWNVQIDYDGDGVKEYTWYNEAFDGITYAVIDTSIEIGFINPYERTSVLDPELTPPNSGKNDFFTSYSYSQFKMKEYCELYKTTIGKVGKYRDYDICSEYLDEIMISDIFLIPNVNVQDLK